MASEFWDLLDMEGRPTGRTVSRMIEGSDPAGLLGPGDWHRVVQVVVFNPEGRLLIQQRSSTKVEWPDAWDLSAGGSVLAGETSQQGASRELLEEVGIDHDFTGQRPSMVVTFPKGFFDLYIVDVDCDPSTLVLQEEEVQAVRWATCQEILDMIDEGVFCGYHRPLIELIVALHRYADYMRVPPPDLV